MSKTVLIVDDSDTVRQQVADVLGRAGYDVAQAEDGQAGAEKIHSQNDIAMVICDVNMPRMNGIDMVGQVKSNGQHADLPIVMLTTEGSPSLIKQAKENGAKGWIVKPFKPDHLLALVKKLVG